MLTPTLDKGEAETVVLATELGVATVFLDDRRGRKVAQSGRVQVAGIRVSCCLQNDLQKSEEFNHYSCNPIKKAFDLAVS